ncbi:MAG: cupin domain-containing protein [Blastopirellula sp. JB062]
MPGSEKQLTQTYSSADFDKTPLQPQVVMPDRLIHRDVQRQGGRDAYSAERKHPVAFVDLPSKCISMTIGGLAPGQSSNMHRHTYETILYVLEGEGYSTIQGEKIEWSQGDALYIPVWAWHRHTNVGDGDARYLACENAPLLQNIGGIALREEAGARKESDA